MPSQNGSSFQPGNIFSNILNPTKSKIYILFLKCSSKNSIKSLSTKSGFSPAAPKRAWKCWENVGGPSETLHPGEQGHRGTYVDREERGPYGPSAISAGRRDKMPPTDARTTPNPWYFDRSRLREKRHIREALENVLLENGNGFKTPLPFHVSGNS